MPINAAQMIDEDFEDGQLETHTNVIDIPFPMPEENLAQSLVIMDGEFAKNMLYMKIQFSSVTMELHEFRYQIYWFHPLVQCKIFILGSTIIYKCELWI